MTKDEIIPLPMVPVVRTQIIINAIVACFAVLLVSLRLYSRSLGAGFGWDDGWILVAVIFSWALFGEQVAIRNMGEGYNFNPQFSLYPALAHNVPIMFKLLFTFGIIYLFALASVKMSVLSFYKRTFSTEPMKRMIWATMGLVFVWLASHTLAFIFVCRPTQAWWDVAAGTCGNLIPIYASIVVVNIITDVIIMALPMYTIWHLQMRKTEKVALTLAFGLGIASIIVACKRLSAVFGYNAITNPTGTVGESAFLCVLETFLALCCVNIPMMRPLIRGWVRSQSTSRLEESEGPGCHFSKNSKQSGSRNMPSGDHSSRYCPGREEWDMVENNGTSATVDSASIDDTGSEKRFHSHDVTQPPPGHIAVCNKWAVTHGQL
ncbi:hypothetical protein M426DRAFT_17538 [Hypoxylon sp. CI-4A]|nr:hypothetical protein M426DRAFT_17538 [Hypoxylon sp. CI-4A]